MTESTRQSPAREPLLRVVDLSMSYSSRVGFLQRGRGVVRAVDRVSFDIWPGETVGLVGESGCGKSSLARTIARLRKADSGQVLFGGQDLLTLGTKALRRMRRDIQIIFQDPYASLNPRMTVAELLQEAWRVHPGIVARERWDDEVANLLRRVGLNPEHASRYPRQFSGGQRQRICIARALATRPKLIICDEAVAALDVSIKAQILNLLKELQRDLGLAYLFISHDLGVVRHVCDRVAVMYLAQVVELAPKKALFATPAHPYTEALLSAAPTLAAPGAQPTGTQKEIILEGDVPSPLAPPPGCRFHTRCWLAADICRSEQPQLLEYQPQHLAACHFAADRLAERVGSVPAGGSQ